MVTRHIINNLRSLKIEDSDLVLVLLPLILGGEPPSSQFLNICIRFWLRRNMDGDVHTVMCCTRFLDETDRHRPKLRDNIK